MRALILAVVLLAPQVAAARARAPMIHYDPPPSVHVVGPATVGDVKVTVGCAVRWRVEWSATCKVSASFDVLATGPVTLTTSPGLDVIAGAQPTLAAGERTRVTVIGRRWMKTSSRFREPWFLAPMAARHFLLGSSAAFERQGGASVWPLVSGADVTLDGAPAVAGDGDGRVVIGVAGHEHDVGGRWIEGRPRPAADDPAVTRERRVTLSMALPARSSPSGLLRGGGPVLALGAREARFLLRGGWEVGLGEHVFVSAAVETDFDSVIESIVVDVASPEILLIIPSLRVGAGVVARQGGSRDPDVGLRLRAGANVMAIGTDVDFDYVPAHGWTVSATGRFSL